MSAPSRIAVGSWMIGVSGRPRSPEKTIRVGGVAILVGGVDDDDGRAQDVAGVEERGRHARSDLDDLAVGVADEAAHGTLGVLDVIERLEVRRLDLWRVRSHRRLVVEPGFRRLACRPTRHPLRPLAMILGLLSLDLAAVEQDEPRQLDRRWRGVDRPREALADEDRDEAAMVEVRVGQQQRVDRRGLEGEGEPVALAVPWRALEHAAIHEHLRPWRSSAGTASR